MKRLYAAIKMRMLFCKQHDMAEMCFMVLASLILTYFALSHLLKGQWFEVVIVISQSFVLLQWLYYGVVLKAFRKHYGKDFPK
jgi:hypothetical protein